MDPRDSGRIARSLETLHSLSYFSPDVEAALVRAGLRQGRTSYFASRAAPMGRVGAGVVTATFYSFHPGLVAACMRRAWDHTTPEEAIAARFAGVTAAYTRLLGAQVLASDELAEAADLARHASAGCTPEGRPLYAAHADLPWPTEPHLVLFHALTLLREHRGDGHIAALLAAGLSGLDALLTHTAGGRGFTPEAARHLRGYSTEEWEAGQRALVERDLVDGNGGLTEVGARLRAELEHQTNRLGAAPWDHLGAAGAARLAELGKPLVVRALGAGAFPAGIFSAA